MMRKLLATTAFALGLAVTAASAGSRADATGMRLLNFDADGISHVVVKDLDRSSARYYMTFSVTNDTDSGLEPRIRIELRTDTDKVYQDRFDAQVAAQVKKVTHAADTLPSAFDLREKSLDAGGSRKALAVFGSVDPNADVLEGRVYGLWNPIYRDRKGQTWSERRVLVLKYRRAGDEYRRTEDDIRLVSSKEELEGEPVMLKKAE